MKIATIITPFDNYSYYVRIRYIEKYLFELGYEVIVISSDYDHRNKKVYETRRNNLELIHVPPYKKNLSFARINSHRVFAKNALKRIEDLRPDLIYCSAPPNLLFKYISKYKRRNYEVKLFFEVGDLWPETLPVSFKLKRIMTPVLRIWADIRDKNIRFADEIVYECKMFKDVVSKAHPGVPSEVIYLCKEDYYNGEFVLSVTPSEVLRFAYVGAINNIIDINLIIEILREVGQKKKVELVIIGGGENEEGLLKECEEADIKYCNYGIVYDEGLKHQILSSCQFGLNIMKDSVAVGATMKSLEYFHEGLILLNNILADTKTIVSKYNCGFNVSRINLQTVASQIETMSETEIVSMRMNSRKVFESFFSENVVRNKFCKIFEELDGR